jgi:hypothetical protein
MYDQKSTVDFKACPAFYTRVVRNLKPTHSMTGIIACLFIIITFNLIVYQYDKIN